MTVGLALAAAMTTSLSFSLCDQSAAAAAPARRHLYKGSISSNVAAADRLLVKGKYEDAAKFYQAALRRNPRDRNAALGLGMVLTKQFKLDGAESQFDKVLASDSNNPGAHAGKAMVLLNRLQSSSNTIRKGKDNTLKEAETEAVAAVNADPQMPEAHYALGMVYKEQGRLGDAETSMKQAIAIDPRYSDGHTGLGLIKLAQNNIGSASAEFKQAIRINSGDWTAHYGLGQGLLRQGQSDAALKELNIAQYQFPNSWPVRLALGKTYETQGNTVAAVREYQESIRIKPENPAAYLGIANIREIRGDLEHSIAELRSGIELMPDNAELRLRVGDESLRLGKLDDSIKEYETILATTPGSARAAEGLTTAYYLKSQKETTGGYFGDNDYANAEQLIARAIQMNPNDMRLRLAQAKLRALSGEPVDLSAIRAPQNDGERVSYAQALVAQNRFKEATAQMNVLIASAPDAKQTFAIGDIALMVHDLDSAEAAYKKAATYSGGGERARRGLAQVGRFRETARKSYTLASDLQRKNMTGSSIDTYHDAVFANPRVPEVRLGLAKALENVSKPTPVQLREAATQYRAYVALMPNLPVKDQDKLAKKAVKLDLKAGKVEVRSVAQSK